MPASCPELIPMLVAGGSVSAASEPASAARSFDVDADPYSDENDKDGCAATVVGSSFSALRRLHASWRMSGSWPDGAERSPLCVAGETLATCAGLSVGHTARVRVGKGNASALLCRVSGILSTGESEDQEIFVALPALQEVTGSKGRLSLAAFSIDGGVDAVQRAAAVVQTAVPGSEARPLRQVAAAQGAILDKLDRMMFLLTLVVLVLTGLCLVTTLTAIVVERQAEIGLMRSIGAGDRQILTMFLGELGLLGIVGSALGFALGAAGARMIGFRLFGTAIEPRLAVAPAVVLLSLGVCLVSMLLPLRRALRVQPAAALRGD
jgi:putative ABC transport system permease protein